MKVAIGGIIHDRWTIEPYLAAMGKLDQPCEVAFCWVVDGSQELAERLGGAAVVNIAHLSGEQYERQESKSRAIYARMATLRNLLATLALGMDCDALLSVDSDVIVPPDLLTRLLATKQDWVAPLVRNDAKNRTPRGHWNVFKLTQIERQGGLVDHFRPMGDGWPTEDVLAWDPRDEKKERCLAAGACCLYSRKLLEAVRWRTDGRGRQEDIGFAVDAHLAGYRASYVPVRCRHLTVDGIE